KMACQMWAQYQNYGYLFQSAFSNFSDLSGCSNLTPKSFQSVLSKCPQLESLKMVGLSEKIPVAAMLEGFSSKNLKVLHVDHVNAEDLQAIASSFPNLEDLVIPHSE